MKMKSEEQAGRITFTSVIVWNASNQPAGLYLIRLEAGDWSSTAKALLIK